jgi:hypothetical protein
MKLGVKGKKALSIAKKGVVVAGALGTIFGAKKTHEGAVQKVEDTKAKVDAGKVIAAGVADVGKAVVDDVKKNPLKAKQSIEVGKTKAIGIGAAAKIDPVGAAATLQFQKNPTAKPKANAPVNPRYGTPDAGGTGKIASKGGFSATGGGGDIRVCDTKYKGQPNQKRKCKKRVKAGGMP